MAEELKVRHGTCDLRNLEDEEISVAVPGEDAGRTVSREELCQIIEARMRETFELLRAEMARSGHGMLPAGIILTGGAAQLAGTAELGPRGAPDARARIAARRGSAGSSTRSRIPPTRRPSGCSAGAPPRSPSASRSATSRRPAAAGSGRIRDAIRNIFP